MVVHLFVKSIISTLFLSSIHAEILLTNSTSTTAIECLELTLENGMISYADDTMADFDIGTVATHTCNECYALVGVTTRTCIDDDGADTVGVWSDDPPVCQRKYYVIFNQMYCVCKLNSNTLSAY